MRSGNNSNANSGLAYANANNACSNSNTNYGARLNLLRLNRVTLQDNEIVTAFREGYEPRQQQIGLTRQVWKAEK
ncbi:hypothetical protein EEL40_00390 [Muribaculaceae bacterium Isolate-083 (Janvier)]|nr:hypothetical protein EEL37_01405 [Muribaculaceae bacterium Isolate-077 (Janvier)]ROT00722.1 hypothetical protein EEL40_00390 [Muribaculaceae bacterium Isolate-083 (Janvier)]ROT02482.1 hypothetical protein EEL41_01405 [Muribaculaceae bacterium Isolate-084 (Janvier)]